MKTFLTLPVVSLGAEHLTMGHLLRRNILTYKAPPRNEGYDLICIHPDPTKVRKQIRVQVKSRYQIDCNRAVLLKERAIGAFDYLVIVFLNIGYFYGKPPADAQPEKAEFYTLPREWVRKHHETKGWEKVRTQGLNLEPYCDEKGFELIARDLGIPYPAREQSYR